MLCTGNAARSVIGVSMLRHQRSDLFVDGAGTHALEGLPMSSRTRLALAAYDLDEPDHRSHQLIECDTAATDLIIGFAPGHVAYVRRVHPDAAGHTATLHHLVDVLKFGAGSLSERVAAMGLADVEIEGAAEVADPAGGDDATFVACADEINALIERLAPLL